MLIVAAIMGTSPAHDLSGLSEDDCWSLFKQCAIGPDKKGNEELINIGKERVKKCGELPFASKALGGLMRSRNTKKEWLELKGSSLWTLSNENHILPALRLSYFHLTPTLKQCFAFCAIFPKDTEILKQDLIHLWMASDFISSRANLDIEKVGNMIWNELYNKSFFQDVKINDESDIKTIPDSLYSLHKLEILKLSNCGKLYSLPKNLTRLQNLRHLVLVVVIQYLICVHTFTNVCIENIVYTL
nr:putative disease resistance protein RGA3 [Arachis hypogaea]